VSLFSLPTEHEGEGRKGRGKKKTALRIPHRFIYKCHSASAPRRHVLFAAHQPKKNLSHYFRFILPLRKHRPFHRPQMLIHLTCRPFFACTKFLDPKEMKLGRFSLFRLATLISSVQDSHDGHGSATVPPFTYYSTATPAHQVHPLVALKPPCHCTLSPMRPPAQHTCGSGSTSTQHQHSADVGGLSKPFGSAPFGNNSNLRSCRYGSRGILPKRNAHQVQECKPRFQQQCKRVRISAESSKIDHSAWHRRPCIHNPR
jgi:hypothetical protein